MTQAQKLDVLAIGAHPDDVELGCGGTLATLVAAGRRVGILHLTRGEAGTRGTPEERQDEARSAAAALGVAAVEYLDCGDGRLNTDEDEEDALIAQLRRWRPEIVLGPPASDRHPDHGRAHRLVADASFYAGLARRGQGEPYRPAAVFSFMQHDAFEPRFVVDVSAAWGQKLAALAAYRSQLHQADSEASGPPTKVASPEFRAAVEGRARHFGQLIGAEFGEPFWSRLPVAISDLMTLVPGGLR
ncbi:MAG: bacillithiol biosynthesis deacetylase BshB1 [Acidobacteria bacterium]|nr:bacillithiol biosynthesis deacetylase BshB1 [Acidobacteriota bacterium]